MKRLYVICLIFLTLSGVTHAATLTDTALIDPLTQSYSAQTLTGSGLIDLGNSLTINALTSPGASPGSLTIATTDLTLGPNSTLIVDIWGTLPVTQHDQLNFIGEGVFNLNGAELQLNFQIDANTFFSPADGDTFDIITYLHSPPINNLIYNNSPLIDDGSIYNININGSAQQFAYIDNNNAITLQFNNPATIPTPATSLITAIGLCLLGTQRRR